MNVHWTECVQEIKVKVVSNVIFHMFLFSLYFFYSFLRYKYKTQFMVYGNFIRGQTLWFSYL